ncbi:hypothetical protein [Tardiphaga sp.]|uniref:hypothetical protein n=1 Tax=Tardiphaga sp. TaxID=1926292 RepID=UPI0037DA29A6
MADEKKLPRATMRDNKLHVEGEKDVYVRGMIRSLTLHVRDLVYHRGYSVDEGKAQVTGRISGTAIIQRRDAIAVAGSKFRSTEMEFSVRAVPPGSEHEWKCTIGFLPYDWEISKPDDADHFYVEVYVTQEAFADAEGAFLAGRATALDIILDTDLWVPENDWHEPQSGFVNWHLVPTENPSDMPRSERGRVEQFGWREIPPLAGKPATPVAAEETPAYKAGQSWASDMVRTAQDDLQADKRFSPGPKKRSWGLVLAWTAFIVLCIGYALFKVAT